MAYEFMDTEPRNEVMAREGYYRDWTHVNADVFYQIMELVTFIREKGHGVDVREVIAQGFERIYHDASIEGNANMEMSASRGSFETLVLRLASMDSKISSTMSQAEFDSWVATLLDGGPSIFMDSLVMLQSTYPNGASGVALVRETDPAKIYVWDGSVWKDFGEYQGVELKDDSVGTLNVRNKAVTNAKLSENYAYVTTLETNTNMANVISEGHYFKLANRVLIGGPVNLAGNAQLFITVNRISEFVTIQTVIDYLNPSAEYRRTIRSGGATEWIRVNLTVDEKSNLDAILLSGLTNFTPVNLLNTDYDLVKKLSAVREIEVIGVDPSTPVKLWVLSRNYFLEDLPWHHRIYLGQKINGTWVKLLDTSALFVVDEVEGGPTQVEVSEGQVTVRLSIDYRLIPEGDRIVDRTQLAEEPNFVINPKNVKLTDEPENPFPDDFEVYDQSLNTFDSVTFTSLSTDVLDIGGQLPAGTLASPPTGLLKGDMWADTTDSATNPILRVKI